MSLDIESETPFEQGIRTLIHRGGSVPNGWQPAYTGTIAKLHAVACDSRAHVKLDGPFMADCNVYVYHSGGDHVVAGILRALERRTSQTCEVCARPGKLRVWGRSLQVLCPVCAAPRLALHAVSQILNDLSLAAEGGPSNTLTFEETPFQLRPMLPADFWKPLIHSSGDKPPTYVTDVHRLQALRPHLETVRRTLVETLEAVRGS